ncbi:MAG: GNAT family N-acetyltransferase [Pirellulaceae bacterium]|nr:GNAT family N-acetyltransferase [Pirellulaceae bacterium]
MKLRALEAEELPAYDQLARSHGTLFNRVDWLSMFGDRVRLLGLFDKGDRMVGGAAVYAESRFGLTLLRRAPFTPGCGPFLKPAAKNPVARLEEHREALSLLLDYVESLKPAICMLPLNQQVRDVMPLLWRKYKAVPAYTYQIDLTQALDEIRSQMSPTRRNDISKAVRDGVEVRQISDPHIVYELVLSTFRRQSKAVDTQTLNSILHHYRNEQNSFAFCAYRDALPVAVSLIVHDGTIGYYLLGGAIESNRHHGAGAVALFAAIEHAHRIGLKVFDFEGSVIPAIERFFRGFGGRLVPYYTMNKAWLPLEMLLKFKKREWF